MLATRAIVTVEEPGQPLQRDSIPGDYFDRDFLTHNGPLARATHPDTTRVLAAVEVRARGYKVWRRKSVKLPARLVVDLAPNAL